MTDIRVDKFCERHEEFANSLLAIRKQLDNTVARWMIIGLVSLSVCVTGYLIAKIEKHNELINSMAVNQATMIANQSYIQNTMHETVQTLQKITDIQITNSNSIKELIKIQVINTEAIRKLETSK